MRYVIPIMLSLSMLSMGNAREEENCDCEVCLKDQINQRIKDRAAEEARRRRERIHNRKLQPRIVLNFHRPLADRNGRVIHYHYHFDRWNTGYSRYRRFYRRVYRTRPPSYRIYRDRTRLPVDNDRKVWYDGLRTRTDRPQNRR